MRTKNLVLLELEDKIGYKIPHNLSRYDITWHDYKHMLEIQNFKCANGGCLASFLRGDPNWTRACIDHCHKTALSISLRRSVRGLLCHKCNITLGFAEDSPCIMRGLSDYVELRPANKILHGPDGVKKDEAAQRKLNTDYQYRRYVAPGEEEFEKQFAYVQSLKAQDIPGTYREKIPQIKWKGRQHYRPYLDPANALYSKTL